jgi:hypothetical protein
MKYVGEVTKEFLDRFSDGKLSKDERLLSVTIHDSGFYVNIWSAPGPFGCPDQYWFDSLFSPGYPYRFTKKELHHAQRYARSVCKCLGIPEGNLFDVESKVAFLRKNNYAGKLFSFKGYKNIEELRARGLRTLKLIRKQVREFENKQFALSVAEAALRNENKKRKIIEELHSDNRCTSCRKLIKGDPKYHFGSQNQVCQYCFDNRLYGDEEEK